MTQSAVRCYCEVPAHHVPRRVVLTGGPGAGKTAVLEVVRRRLCEHVQIIPEAAGIVFGGGFPRRPDAVAREAAQMAIYHVQSQLEHLTLSEEGIALALCDRGVLDGLAYWPGPVDDFFRQAHTTREEALGRYHAVIHLRTPFEHDGYDHSNPLRIESAGEAIAIDERLLQVWEGHPRRFVVDSAHDFLEKLTRTLAILESELPDGCAIHFSAPTAH